MKTSTLLNKKQQEEKIPEVAQQRHSIKFLILSEFGELLDLAIWLSKAEGYDVLFCTLESEYKNIGKGIVEKVEDWWECLGEDYIWVVDGCSNAGLQDWLRSIGEAVVGTNQVMSDHENDRQKGQKWFKDAGFYQPMSKNFKDIDSALQFVKDNTGTKLILKQNGDLPKHLNHKAKFDSGEDMIFHLEELPRGIFRQITAGVIGSNVLTGGLSTSILPALVLASPRITGEVLRAAGIATRKVEELVSAFGKIQDMFNYKK